ncbi:hypothetical protein D1007_27337 [Hordeum vulgare]|nr:hypothetical protein D1007_27337 [Hordeum vulgare]
MLVASTTMRGKLATAAVDVEKEVAVSALVLPEQNVTVTASSGAVHPDTTDAQPGEKEEVLHVLVSCIFRILACRVSGIAMDVIVIFRRMMDGGKEKPTLAGFDLYDPEYSDDEDYEGNFASFTTKEVEKIKAKGIASFYNRKIKKWRCPYCTTKPKPKDGRFDHLVSHA